jgi:energy-coupling factor transport system permease protein
MLRLDRVNVFIKLAGAALLTALSWIARDLAETGVVAVVVVAIILACRLPQSRGYFKMAALVCALVTVTWTANFLIQGLPLEAAIAEALRMAFRIVATTGSFFVAVETTTAGALLAACSAARLPGMATLVLILIVGMIPLMREEYQRIADTQRARGLELDRGPILRRIRYALAKGVPLMVQTYRLAEAIALSLSLYGFDPKVRRTTWRNVGWLTVEPAFVPPAREA